ncbi:Electron transfer flavoprotein alpha-subunit [Balamuthia mandrillaris]
MFGRNLFMGQRSSGLALSATRSYSSPWSKELLQRGYRALVIGEHSPAGLNDSTLASVTAASKAITKQAEGVDLFLAGKEVNEKTLKEAASIEGVSKVLVGRSPSFEHLLPEDLCAFLLKHHSKHAGQYSHYLAASTTLGKSLIPRLAALLDVSAVSDIIGVEDENTFRRPIYAGNAIATVRSEDKIKVLTVRGTAFEKAALGKGNATVEEVSYDDFVTGLSSWQSEELQRSARPELSSASIVVSGGRGVKSKENFALIEKLADRLGAAVGASRAAVDAGYAPNDWQVGQTGKVVAPQLYIAVGISGQIQHLAGMKDSKVIVAINNNADAPIFQVADYGLVEDLFKAVPELVEKLPAQQA